MLPNIPLIAERRTITCNRGAINVALLKSNQQWINYDYFVGQQVLKYDITIKVNFAIRASNPFEIVCIHVNGTVAFQLRAGVTKWVNICCVSPIRTLWYNWRLSYSRGESIVHESITWVPVISIPKNFKILDSLECLPLLFVLQWMITRW